MKTSGYLTDGILNQKVSIRMVSGDRPFLATCRRMSKRFKTRRAAIGWLSRRGFDEYGNRI